MRSQCAAAPPSRIVSRPHILYNTLHHSTVYSSTAFLQSTTSTPPLWLHDRYSTVTPPIPSSTGYSGILHSGSVKC